jgi:hypothetical protein
MLPAALRDHCATHHGVITLRCADAVGVDRRRVVRQAASEMWEVLLEDRAWLLPGAAASGEARCAAAALTVGGAVAVTGWSALAAFGAVKAFPTRTELVVPETRRVPALGRIDARRTRRWGAVEIVQLGGVPFTTLASSLALLGPRVSAERRRAIALQGQLEGQLADGELDRVAAAWSNTPFAAPVRSLARDLEVDGSESGFEFSARGRLVAQGLVPTDEQVTVEMPGGRERRIDIPFLPARVGIECVGRTYRSSPDDFEEWVERHNQFAELGDWVLLELSWRTFHTGWERFVHRLRRTIARRAPT